MGVHILYWDMSYWRTCLYTGYMQTNYQTTHFSTHMEYGAGTALWQCGRKETIETYYFLREVQTICCVHRSIIKDKMFLMPFVAWSLPFNYGSISLMGGQASWWDMSYWRIILQRDKSSAWHILQ